MDLSWMLRSLHAAQMASGTTDHQTNGEMMMDRTMVTVAISGPGQKVWNIAMWMAVSAACRRAWL